MGVGVVAGGQPFRQPGPEGLLLVEEFLSAALCERASAEASAALCAGRAGGLPSGCYAPPPPAMARRGQGREQLCYGARVHANRVEARGMPSLPPAMADIAEALHARGLLPSHPTACSVNMYEGSNWLPPHIDSRAFARPFAVVSLGPAAARVAFGEALVADGQGGVRDESDGGAYKELVLEPRSALVVDGTAADVWRHAVLTAEAPRTSAPRASLVFRSLASEGAEAVAATHESEATMAPPQSPLPSRAVLAWHRSPLGSCEDNALYADLGSDRGRPRVCALVSVLVVEDGGDIEVEGVEALRADLRARGGGLVVRRGDPAQALAAIARRMADHLPTQGGTAVEVRFHELPGKEAEAAMVSKVLRSLPGGRVRPCGGGHGGGRTLWHAGRAHNLERSEDAPLPLALPPWPTWLPRDGVC